MIYIYDSAAAARQPELWRVRGRGAAGGQAALPQQQTCRQVQEAEVEILYDMGKYSTVS